MNIKLLKGDCLDKLKELKDNSVDSVVTDPPYEIGFMNKGWDNSGIANNTDFWKEVLRVLKPGGHLLSFSHSRTYHRQAVAVEDAGFEIRDQILWVYGSGFPKSHNVANAIDKLMGQPNRGRAIPTASTYQASDKEKKNKLTGNKVEPYKSRTEQSQGYEGWGTALKPAHEPIVMARKPFKGTVAKNVLEWGTGGINIDGCRIGYVDDYDKKHQEDIRKGTGTFFGGNGVSKSPQVDMQGRFPANIIFDEEAGKILDEQSGISKSSGGIRKKDTETQPTSYDINHSKGTSSNAYAGEVGGASRFFYCPKASKKDRNEGLEHIESKSIKGRDEGQDKMNVPYKVTPTERQNIHPTVKPTDLMAYLVRLVTPKGGTVLDPFMGSGSTGKACVREGFDFIGIEREDEYLQIATSRIEHEKKKNKHREFFDE